MATLTMKYLQEQIEKLSGRLDALEEKRERKKIRAGIGDTFELAGAKWKVLDILEKGYLCLADKLENEMQFDMENNNWVTSRLREYLNTEYIEKIEAEIGEDNIIPFKRDLISLDGQTEYGECEDKVSLLTVDEYRKYRNLVPNTEDYWWWLISPWSTSCNGWEYGVTVVAPSGYFRINGCDDGYGVRPFCIFSSAIFESEEE